MVFLPIGPDGKVQLKPNEDVMNRSFVPIDPRLQDRLDTGSRDTPISNQNEQGIFDGSTYQPGGSANPENQELYNSIGEETLGGMGPRIQRTTNDQGEQRTYFVPRPEQSEQSFLGSTRRGVEGGILEATKGVLGFGEWMLDTIMAKPNNPLPSNREAFEDLVGGLPNREQHLENGPSEDSEPMYQGTMLSDGLKAVAERADQLLGTEFSDEQTNWIDQNFPTLPAQNDWEKMGQEIVSGIVGAVAGGAPKVATGLGKLVYDLGTEFYNRAKKTDLKNAGLKLRLFVEDTIQEFVGSNVGSTITTPTDVDAFISPNFTPDQIGNLSEDEQNKLEIFLDNTGFSVALGGLGLLAKGVKNVANSVFGGTRAGDLETISMTELFREIDPGLQGVSDEEFKRRAQLFADMVKDNSLAENETFGNYIRGPVRSTIEGAEKYVEEAYGYLRQTKTAEEWDQFVLERAQLIKDNIGALRRDHMSNTAVQASDARINSQANTALTRLSAAMGEVAPEFGEATGIQNSREYAGRVMGGQALEDVQSATDMVNLPRQNQIQAEQALEHAQNEGMVMQALEEARANNILGGTPEEQRFLNNLSGPQLLEEYSKSKQAYTDAFNDLPEGLPYDREALADIIIQSGDVRNILNDINVLAPNNPVRRTFGGDDVDEAIPTATIDDSSLEGKALADLVFGTGDDISEEITPTGRDNLIAALENIDLKDLYTKARPALAKMLDQMEINPTPGQMTGPLVAIKEGIDQAADESGSDAFDHAMDLYRQHQQRFGQITSLEDYSRTADRVLNSGSAQIGKDQLYIQARRALDTALGTSDNTGLELENWTKALYGLDPRNIPPELGDVVLSSALKRISLNGGRDSESIARAIQPFLPALRRLNPEGVSSVENALVTLRSAEQGSRAAADALKEAEAASRVALARAEKTAAYKFLDESADGLIIKGTGDIEATMNTIFGTQGATRDLMQQARINGDEMVINGIQSQYLSYLRSKMFTNSPMSAGPGDFTPNSSGAQLGNFLHGRDTVGIEVMREVFADKPKFADDLLLLMEEVYSDFQTRSSKVQPFGSSTTVDTSRRRALNTLITFTLGTLNRTAATARNIVNNVTGIQQNKDAEMMEQIMAGLLVDTDYLTRTLDRIGDHPDESTLEEAARALTTIIRSTKSPEAIKATGVPVGDRFFNRDERTEDAQNMPHLAQQTQRAFALN